MGLPYNDETAARLGGDLLFKSGNAWQHADRVWVKDSGTWRSSENIYVKSGGTWRNAAQYDIYRFRLTLSAANNGSNSANVNYAIQEKQSSGNSTTSGNYNFNNTTFKLTNVLEGGSSWSNHIAYGAIYVNSTQRYLRINSLPSGSKIILYVNSNKRILGKGGNGGNGSQQSNNGGNGQSGQTALYVRTNTTLVNSGQIGGGGGGGGGGRGAQCTYVNQGQQPCMKGNQCPVTYQNFSQEQGGGGGGGAGYPGGTGGDGSPNGSSGQSNANGSAGANQSCGATNGRNGGLLGNAGQNQGQGSGTPGAAGNAIDGVSYITKETAGTINGPEVN